jgi:hypothetical protein
VSAIEAARRAGLLAKHVPTLAYHKQEPYWASSPAVMTDCALEGRYATYLQTKNGEVIAQAGRSLARPHLDLAFLNGTSYGNDVEHKPSGGDYLNAHAGTYVEDAARMQALPGCTDVIYGRYVKGAGDRVWLQYWLFYYYNDKSLAGIGLHEGDWEMVQVGIDRGVPTAATYAQHTGAEKRDDWNRVRKADGSSGASPLVYVGLGSHASYFDPGEYRIKLFPVLDHARGNGRRVLPRLVELDGDAQWLEWPGRWGRLGLSDTSSPRGPMQHETQWLRPDEFHRDARGPRRKLGPIFFAVPPEARVPSPEVAAHRDGDQVVIAYDLRGARKSPERPVRLLLSVESGDPVVAPVTHSFLVAQERATVRHPARIGHGDYVVHATALTAYDAASETITVPVASGGGVRGPATDREGFSLRLLVELPEEWSGGIRAVRKAVDAALARDADGQTWQVDYLFGRGGPARLRRHMSVTGRAIVAPAYPPQQQAFDLAHRLSEAIGAPVLPDLPSSVFARDTASDTLPGRMGAEGGRKPATTPKDWSLRKIRAPEAWQLEPGRGAGITVGHPDTGFTQHPELEPDLLDLARAWDVLDDDPDARDPLKRRIWWPLDSPGHGTATGSVIAGRTAGEIQGAAPGVTLVPLRTVKSVVQVFDGDVALAVDRARRAGCDIVSMSLGGVGFAEAVRDAIRTAVESGMIVMAAAGNEVGFVTAPASWPECLAIGGIGITDAPWSGSSHGPTVDFCAPAEAVWAATARLAHGQAAYTVEPHDGTSFAVANTAGVAALWLAHHGADALRRRYGRQNVQRLFLTLARQTARRPAAWDAHNYGAGILDARALLEAALPDPATFARRSVRATAPTPPGPLDRLATLWPELTQAQVRSALGRQLGKRGAALDAVLERFGGELFYQYSQDAELRRSLAQPPSGATGVRRVRAPAATDLPRTSSRALSRALGR